MAAQETEPLAVNRSGPKAAVETLVVTGRDVDRPDGQSIGTRLSTPVEEQPLPIQILDSAIFDRIGGARLDDVIDFAVGGVQGNQFGGTSENFLFRGFAASVADDGVLQNGTVAGNPRRRDAAAIERTEILRGPASALFGQGGPGGVVNAVRKRPSTEDFFGSVTVEGSSLIRTRGEFDVNVPVTEDVAVRLITAIEGGNSFRFQDAFDEAFTENRQFVAPSILFTPGERTSILLRGEYLRTENPFDRGILFTNDGERVGERGDFFGDPSIGTIVNEDLSGFLEVTHAFNENWSVQATGAAIFNDFAGTATEPVFIFPEPIFIPAETPIPLAVAPGVTLPLVFDNPIVGGDTLLRSVEDRDFENDTLTARFDVNGAFETGLLAHNILISLEYQHVDQFTFNSNSVLDFPPLALPDGTLSLDLNTIDVTNPILESGLPLTFEGGAPIETTVDTFGLIFFDQIDIGDRVHILGGGRVDFVDQRTEFSGTTLLGGVPNTDEIEETAFSPRAGIVVEPLRDVPLSLFFSYSESFVVNLPSEFDTETVDPQEGRVFEGGIRFDLIPDQLQVTATGFDIEVENVPATVVAFGPAVPSTQSSRGVELTAQGRIGETWSVLANYAYLETDVTVFVDGVATPGTPLVGVADHVASGLITYAFQDGRFDRLSLGAGIVYQSGRTASLPTSFPNLLAPLAGGPPAFELGSEDLEGFIRLDLFAAYAVTDTLEVNFGIQNVTDALILQPSVPATTRPDPGINGFVRLRKRF